MQNLPVYDLAELIPNYFASNLSLGIGSGNNDRLSVPLDEKGLLNFIGENNCFINVVIQSLWHLEPFRSKFTTEDKVLRDHHHEDKESCVYCSLEIIFTQYEFSDDVKIPPTALRKTMALLYKSQSRFQLFEIDDAAEAFEAVLSFLHNQYEIIDKTDSQLSRKEHSCGNKKCIAHRVFGLKTVEHIECTSCGASTEPIKSTLFTAYSYAAGLRSVYAKNPTSSFCEIIAMAGADKRCCPNRENCDKMCPITHSLLSLPEIFTVSIVWDSADPSVSEVESILNMISWQIDLGNIFHLDSKYSTKFGSSCLYRLRGMICYYGKHYTAYFYSVKNQQWFVFDDSTVKPIGVDWPTIRSKCLKGHLQPSMLFYEREEEQVKITESMLEHPQLWTSSLLLRESRLSESTMKREELERKAQREERERKEKEKKILENTAVNTTTSTKPNENSTKPNPNSNKQKTDDNLSKDDSEEQPKKIKIIKVKKNKKKRQSMELIQEAKEEIKLENEIKEKMKEEENHDDNEDSITIVNSNSGSQIKISKIKQNDKELEQEIKETAQTQTTNDTVDNNTMTANVMPSTPVPIVTKEVGGSNEEMKPKSMESFILLPSESQMDVEKDFVVTRTNWLYRRQERVFRFKLENFARILPNSLTIKETFEYKDVFDITVTDPQNMIIRFYSGKEAQYLQSEHNTEILDILIRRAKLHGHSFNVKRI